MIHPLLRLVATQPQLLADHAEAYAGLVGEEIGRSVSGLKQRVLLISIALGLVAVAAVLAGVALMLWAVFPPASIQAPWALIAAPGVPALVAVVCLLVGRSPPPDTFAELKQQVAADLVMLREVSAA
ncbi:MAG: hypothetical protein ABI781_02450 [Burkholderiales bacterium]